MIARCLCLLFIGLNIVPIIFAFFVSASENPLETLFAPMKGLNIVEFYASNHFWFDFLIFLFLFIPIAKMTIGKRFGGKDGNILSGVIGLVLALSLFLAEERIGFSIRSFGPIAAGILIFVVGLVIFYLIKTIGAGSTSAGSMAFIVSYFLMRGTVPNFFLWLEENSWTAWINLVLAVAIVISIGKLFIAILPKGESWVSGRTSGPSYVPNSNLRKTANRENDEIFLVKSSLENITKKGIMESKEITSNLKEVINIINEYGNNGKGRNFIADKIRQIASRENLIIKQLATIKDICQKIEKFDFKSFSELRAKWDKIPDKEKEFAKTEILAEKKKILSDEKLIGLESKLIQYDRDFRNSLNMAVGSLRANQTGQAREWLLKAIRSEEEAMILFKEMKNLEDMLLKLTRMEFKTLNREAKEAA
jgi:hypothetical protein